MRRLAVWALIAIVCAGVLALRSPAVSDWIDRVQEPTATVLPVPGGGEGARGLIVLPEDGPAAILDELDFAQTSIDLYVYLLPADEVLTALTRAQDRGVTVRVILERDPFGGGNSNQDAFDRLDAAGIEVRWAPQTFHFSHIKTFVVDRRVAAIMTLNLSWSALTRNREFAVISTRPEDVAAVSGLFDADWSGGVWQPTGDIIASPDNSRRVLRDLIDGAAGTIEIYAEVVRDADLRQRLIDAAERGVIVRLLVPSGPSADDLLIYDELANHAVEVKLLADAYSHAKAIIVDGIRAFVGSQNLTMTSLDRNRECGILLDDSANLSRLVATFRSDWEASERATVPVVLG
jgi:cardiolipin synthase